MILYNKDNCVFLFCAGKDETSVLAPVRMDLSPTLIVQSSILVLRHRNHPCEFKAADIMLVYALVVERVLHLPKMMILLI